MGYGSRTWVPFGLGLVFGTFFGFLAFTFRDANNQITPHIQTDIQTSEHWDVQLDKFPIAPNNAQNPPGKVVRARFAGKILLSYLI